MEGLIKKNSPRSPNTFGSSAKTNFDVELEFDDFENWTFQTSKGCQNKTKERRVEL